MIFLDQPVNVGYSYASESVSTTEAAAEDFFAFMQLFYHKFPQYHKDKDLHIAAESYGGRYAVSIQSFAKESSSLTAPYAGVVFFCKRV